MIIFGIETSCDETAVALVNNQKQILAHCLKTQIPQHQAYGGVVPELAARAHLDYLPDLAQECLKNADLEWNDVAAIAATAGPGLIGGVLVGVMAAKALAASLQKPFIAINHLEAHALTPRLSNDLPFPFLLLLVSGGHSQFVAVNDLGNYQRLGGTIDDAVGEAFDKVALMLGLDYPGGPEIERLALEGMANRFAFPRPLKGKPGCDLSFSGLKTAVRHEIEKLGNLELQDRKDVAASFQQAVCECLLDRTRQAFEMCPELPTLVVAGGVAANQKIRQGLSDLCQKLGKSWMAPPLSLCTDNAAMIAWAGIEHFQRGDHDSLDFVPRPRWPLEEINE